MKSFSNTESRFCGYVVYQLRSVVTYLVLHILSDFLEPTL